MPTRLDFATLSLMDALDLATLIEVEAYKRYTQFAEQLGSSSDDDAASVFQSWPSTRTSTARRSPSAGLRCSATCGPTSAA